MAILIKEIVVLVPFLPMAVAVTMGLRGAYAGE